MYFGIAFHFFQKAFRIQIAAANAQNTTLGIQQTGGMRLIKAGQQLAHRQITCCTENHHIKVG